MTEKGLKVLLPAINDLERNGFKKDWIVTPNVHFCHLRRYDIEPGTYHRNTALALRKYNISEDIIDVRILPTDREYRRGEGHSRRRQGLDFRPSHKVVYASLHISVNSIQQLKEHIRGNQRIRAIGEGCLKSRR
ncbi:MAG: hypothetical protein UT63_C0058G0014 [Candidatus Gottesmanbacteria bacterium GW2011_GWC2_39_8]|uniref:Uncharacterized protein n=1 Tax=Candidatus Gottesmanbacteria bacterium GW2011_GWC2_39_8 TaxID=1618450 RepID=A0A0G0PVD3_9BACT|nr:MAG: hypothetical protein UT63_C0058G0014 [Candidatus Gottesmanbacteria bacterium GW2011_GWC2_39_8]